MCYAGDTPGPGLETTFLEFSFNLSQTYFYSYPEDFD